MKKNCLKNSAILFFVLISYVSHAQLGVKVGMSSFDIIQKEKTSIDSEVVENASYGFHFGGYYRLKLGGLYVEPTILFNSQKVDYKYKDPNVVDSLKSGTYKNIDVPLLVGYKVSLVQLFGGPVAHFSIDKANDLVDYKQRFKEAKFGYQAGAGLAFKALRILLTYEGNFNAENNTINVLGVKLNTADRKSRVLLTLAYDLN